MDDPALFMPHLEFTQNLGLTHIKRRSNDHIMNCLGMSSPNEVLDLYRGIM